MASSDTFLMRPALAVLLAWTAAAADPTVLLRQYCTGCHDAKTKVAGFDIDQLLSAKAASMLVEFRRWELIAEQLATRTMPPAPARQPSDAERKQIVAWIDSRLASLPLPANSTPLPAPARRLTRFEFANSIRDLTGADIDLSAFLPPDGASADGLPNNAGTLFVSGPQIEKILAASEQLMERAVFSPVYGLRFPAQPPAELRHHDRVRQAIDALVAAYFSAIAKHLERNGEGIAKAFASAWEAGRIGKIPDETTRRWLDFLKLDYARLAIQGGGNGVPGNTAEDFNQLRRHFDPLFAEFTKLGSEATAADALAAGRRFYTILERLRQTDEYVDRVRAGDHSHPFELELQGRLRLYLLVTDGGGTSQNDYAAWLDPAFHMADGTVKPATTIEEQNSADRVVGWNKDSLGGALHIFEQASDLRGIRNALYKDPATMTRDNVLYRDNTLPWNAAISVKAPSLLVLAVPPGARRFTVRGAMQDLARTRLGEKSRPWYEDGMVQFFVSTERPASLDFVPGARLTLANRTQQQILRRYYDALVTRYFPSPAYYAKILDERFALPPGGIIHRNPDDVAATLPAAAAADKQHLVNLWREYLLLCSEPRMVVERTQGVLNAEYRRMMSRGRIKVQGREATWAEIRAISSPEILEEVDALDKLLEMGKRELRVAAQKHLNAFASRAFRRPVTPAESAQLIALYDSVMKSEKAYTGDAVRFAARSVIASPHFLLLREPSHQHDLAARLSYFLWSGLPDAELAAEAASARLSDPAALVAQARRMLSDDRSAALADQFTGSWLRFRQIREHDEPNRDTFPQYTHSLREAMYQEAQRFIHAIFKEDLSILNVLDSDWTFLNEELAGHYRIEGVKGPEFRRVKINRSERGGLLGMGGVLTLTSHPARTSPVGRGVFVLAQVLGTPPPPPPPNAANQFEEKISRSTNLTARQQLEMHRDNPACSSCHRRIDPVGFSLEAFDAIGRFRTKDAASGQPIDTRTVLPDGVALESFADLKQALLRGREKDKFVRNFCRQLLAYALGRGVDWRDLELLRRMERSLAAKQYRVSAAVEEIVRSSQFRAAGNGTVKLAVVKLAVVSRENRQ